MKHSAQAHLYDIREAGRHIQQFTHGISLQEYCGNPLVKAAVERKFGIIGEALVRLRREYPDILVQITDSTRIIDFRNVLIHGYDVVDDATVWSAVHENLPILLSEVEFLLTA